MSVEIEPQELGFRRPFTVEVARTLKLNNTTNSPVAFKVKTTAPKQYCVRPNSGRIEPGHDVEVSVLLQAMKSDPPLDTKCRDKFLVQSVAIIGSEDLNVQQIWDNVDKSSIQERKIRVNFLPAGGSDENTALAATPIKQSLSNGADSTPDASKNYSSPPEQDRSILAAPVAAATAAKNTIVNTLTPSSASKTSTSTSTVDRDLGHTSQGSTYTAATTSSSRDPTIEALQSQLAQAESQIATLKQQDTGLRQRKAAAGDDKPRVDDVANSTTAATAAAVVRPRGTEGVSVPIVALLCLLSFLLAYFFF